MDDPHMSEEMKKALKKVGDDNVKKEKREKDLQENRDAALIFKKTLFFAAKTWAKGCGQNAILAWTSSKTRRGMNPRYLLGTGTSSRGLWPNIAKIVTS